MPTGRLLENRFAVLRLDPVARKSQPFPQLDVIDLTGPEIDAFKIDLMLPGHVDVRALEEVLLPVDLEENGAFLQFDGHVHPLVERQELLIHGERLNILLDRQGRPLLSEKQRVDVMAEIEQREPGLVGLRVVSHAQGADEVLRHLLEPDHRF